MSGIANLSRRRFLAGSALAGGGLVLGVYVPRLGAAEPGKPFAPNAFVRIADDGTVTIVVNHSEMGQGVFTSLPMLVAEELDADWSKVRAEMAPVDPAYNHTAWGQQATGGSTSIRSEWSRLREMGAAARVMLVAAAAAAWSVDAGSCRTENGEVIHDASGRRLSYGELAGRAAGLAPPLEVATKSPDEFRIVGKPTKRLDTPAKTDGTAVFGLDVSVPGMLTAVIDRPPVFGARSKSVDADAAKAVPGVRDVVEIDRGIAVVADGFWAANRGRRALKVEWDDGPLGDLDSVALRETYGKLAASPGREARNDGDADAALGRAAKILEAVYEVPYLAHAPMEPLNCVADVRPDRCEIWTGTQAQSGDRDVAARITGLDPSKVALNTTFLGGGFGRRSVPDHHFVAEAVQVSKAVGAPVKVVWTREDDIRGGYYRPAALHSLRGGLDAAGKPLAWAQRIVCQSFWGDRGGVDRSAVEGASDLPYSIPNVRVDWEPAPGGVPTLWWRSVGHSHTAFAVECFLDELAHAAGADPLELRRSLLADHPRRLGVLELAAEKAGWGGTPPAGRSRGLAVHQSFGSYVAQVAEVSVAKGEVKVHKVVCAVDCGPVVNPDTIAAQMEGAVAFGLTAALYGQITFRKGRVEQGNFDDYPLLRMREMPEVETHIVPSTESVGGIGEPGVPPIAPAVMNAVFAATGKRVRRLPVRAEDLA